MKSPIAVIASKQFLDEVWANEPPSISKLIELLDRLLVSYHDTPSTGVRYDEFSPPETDWKTTYNQTGKQFPEFGFYPIADPSEKDFGATMTGDAIDDIADITTELRNTLWYADTHGVEFANAYFISSHSHWGQHARELLLFLHMKNSS